MLKLIAYIIPFSLIACSSSKQQLSGTYVATGLSHSQFPYTAIHGTHKYVIGTKLNLNTDHTFDYTTCDQITSGKWKTANSSVSLMIDASKYKTDSLNNVEFKNAPFHKLTKPYYETYTIRKNTLVQIRRDSKGRKNLERLVKQQ